MPDVLRKRPVRVIAKSLLLAGSAVYLAGASSEDAWQDCRSEVRKKVEKMSVLDLETGISAQDGVHNDAPAEKMSARDLNVRLGVLAACALTGVGLSLFSESRIFRRGERRREAGHALAHTRQAFWLGVSSGLVTAFSSSRQGSSPALHK